MKIVFLILAHKNPGQLAMLVKELENDNSEFVIHVDKQANLADFIESVKAVTPKSCHFLRKRIHTPWGSFNLVESTLTAFKYIRRHYKKTDRVILLSGQDFPIKSNRFIYHYFKANPSKIFLEYTKIPYVKWWKGGIYRFPNYRYLSRIIDFYCGSQWMSFPVYIIKVIFDCIKFNPELLIYFRTVKIPDESFFHTILLNCDDKFIEENLVKVNLHLIKWIDHVCHPRILVKDDIWQMLNSKKIFARKFEPDFPYNLFKEIRDRVFPV